MKYLIFCFSVCITASAFGQGEFVITQSGLTPRFSEYKIDHSTRSELYAKALAWIKENEKNYKLAIEDEIVDSIIQFSSIKSNAVTLDQRYFHAKHTIQLSFDQGQYRFEPASIHLKINSKYDLGWKGFDLNDSSTYFKNGKVIRKYKSYIQEMTTLLNELYIQLNAELSSS